VAAIVGITLIFHFVWLARFRHGYLTEWDESGYMQFALSNFDALHDHGVVSFVKTVGGRSRYGPLLPSVTAFAYPLVGRGIFGSLLVMPFFFAALVAAAYGVARQMVSSSWATVAALTVASIPAVTDYTRVFHFALPATACMTAALWALLRSNGLLRTRWAVAFGVFVALTALARTMALAYVPGLALAAAAVIFAREGDLRLRIRNLGLAGAAALLVAGPWYVRNARSVYDYLVHTGYGSEAERYGRHSSIASWEYWTKELRLDLSHLSLPLASALVLCFGAGFICVVARRRRLRRMRSFPDRARVSAVAALALVVVGGYVALTSSRNEGSAFALPWLPALVVLAVIAAASVPARTARRALGGVLVTVSLAALLSKSGWVAPLATVRTTSVPGVGSVVVTDGRGVIQQVVEKNGYDIGPITHPLPSMHRRWLPLERDVVGWSLRRSNSRRESLHLTVGLDDHLFASTRLLLAAQLWYRRYLPVDDLHSFPGGDTVASYRRQLVAPQPANALITGDRRRGATIARSKVEAAARSIGFVPLKSFTLPDGRTIWIWWLERSEAWLTKALGRGAVAGR
jgi:4-amino-4-deoxy-L-arabinose transferase-like glycosyltransferase